MAVDQQHQMLFRKLQDGNIQCVACNRYCVIKEGETGACGVRKNTNGNLELIVYGKVIGPGPSPIEKKPMFHFLPQTMTYSIATVGCNFTCQFCQNWDISQCALQIKEAGGDYIGKIERLGYSMSAQKVISEAKRKNCPVIAYTYNEPTVFTEFALECGKLAHQEGMKNVFVTNGYESKECVEAMKGIIDGMNIDLKGFTEEFYHSITGGHLQPVLETIKRCHQLGIWIEITTLIIPGQNDSDEELNNIAQFIYSVDPCIPWHISAFHPDYLMDTTPKTPVSTLRKAYTIGQRVGLKYIYCGNVIDPEREATYCKKCGTKLMQRKVFTTTFTQNFKNGMCLKCQTMCDGVWK
ncbi:hypothetical protein ENUP19_0121G0043 [Entamoeba nuttalli]|uniref:Radical SAM domain containing protein n=2 Tax=Entamoeba nuttalli TaxID=412467 RepID=K2HA04_ENTNP|nr:radical SAM domain containing protein [Entamoeba nuttalli P19]EKE39424.1 radical SAM domain containing protein [Entamoeba nuttalli P19]|eukprot:XP_008858244.1 radical SAM domain containing protein [Entamoeba nuttalli P19]